MRQNIVIFIVVTALILTSSAVAQTSRDDKWEGTLQLLGTSAESSNGEMGSSIDSGNNSADPSLNMWRLHVGWKFQ